METELKIRDDVTTAQSGSSTEPGSTAPGPKRHKRLGLILKNRYRIVSLIASGGTSDVYKATDLYLEKAGAREAWVAIKILRSELTKDANALALLARETAKSKRLSHPNIIRVQDLDHDADTWFMVMELLEGEPLARVVQRAKPRGLQWSGGRAILEQIVSALAFSHSHGVIHADLKPSNIFLTRDGTVKLLDFGVAHALTPPQPTDFLNPRHDDETTIYGYTPAYASPSLIAGRDPEAQDDLYALACIAFELLSSRHPFDRKRLDKAEQASYRLKKPSNMPPRLWSHVRRVLRTEPNTTDLTAFQAALRPRQWKPLLYPIGAAASLLFTGMAWQAADTRAAAAEAQLASYKANAGYVARLSQEPAGTILSAARELPPLERAGLLKLQQERILDHYRGRVKQALQSSSRPRVPNIPGALAILAEAITIYPHNRDLLRQRAQFEQQSHSLQTALREEIEALLEQGDYRTYDALEKIKRLAGDLNFLSPQNLTVTPAAASRFGAQLDRALATDDGPELDRLLQVAGLFFDTSPELKPRLEKAREMEQAVRLLGEYQQRTASGTTTAFPEGAANEFYGDRIARWHSSINAATGSRALDRVYDEVVEHLKIIPSEFQPIAEVRQKLADAYVRQADVLLARNSARQAQPLLRKATQLMRKD